MEVYIEYVLLDNLVINWLIMLATLYLTKKKCVKKRVILTDLIATTCSVVMPWLTINAGLLFLFKVGLGMILVGILSTYRNPKEYCITFFIFLSITFLFGGMCYGIISMLGLKATMSGIMVFGFELPISLFFIAILLYAWLVIKLIKYFKKRAPIENMYYDIVLYLKDKKVACKGFLDTGNKLTSKNNSGLLIVGMNTFCKLFDNINYLDLCQGKKVLENSYYIDVKAVGTSSKMLVTTVDKVEIFTPDKVSTIEHKDIGLAMTNFNEFDCILGSMDVLALQGEGVC